VNFSIVNAQSFRSSTRVPTSLVVAGDERQASYWNRRLALTLGPGHAALVEEQNKGNFLGTLRAYRAILRGTLPEIQSVGALEQIVMLVGSGTRLSPFTQALANTKSAFPLPDAGELERGRNIGEYALRSSLPIVDCLHAGGFNGIVVRWGDEVQVPSHLLGSDGQQYRDVDAVRFGWKVEPTELLATQKEWMLTDASGIVVRDVVRQPLDQLRSEFASSSATQELSAYVNLGSLAASHELLEIACEVFDDEIDDQRSAANWDPYFWMALQCHTATEWGELGRAETRRGHQGIRALMDSQPNFFERVHRVKRLFERRKGRAIRVAVLDFGEPYWFDVGSHFALRKILADVFSMSHDGQIVRALLDIPDGVAEGDSLVLGSQIASGTAIINSVVLGATITDPRSVLEGAIVLGGEYGHLVVQRGGAAIQSVCETLTVEGPHGIAFRLKAFDAKIRGGESVASIGRDQESFTLRYDDSLGSINHESYERVVLDNAISFQQAARLMGAEDPQ